MKKGLLLIWMMIIGFPCIAQTVNFNWAKRMGAANNDLGISIGVDASGNVYTVGTFTGNVDFDPGPGTFMLNSLGVPNTYISKFSSTGNFIWAKQIRQFTPGLNIGGFIAVDPSGSIIYSSTLVGIVDADPGPGIFPLGTLTSLGESFITKLNAAGNFVWARRLAGGNNGILSLKTDPSGNILATGLFNTSTDFDPGGGTFTLTSNGLPDAFILKLNSSGNFTWARQISGPALELSLCLDTDASGNVYATGSFSGTVDFDPGPGIFNLTAGGLTNAFALKLDNGGNLDWAKNVGGLLTSEGNSLLLDNNGDLQLTGSFSGTADFDPGPGNVSITSAGLSDVFILTLDNAGNYLGVGKVGGTGADRPTRMAKDTAGKLYLTGTFSATTDFDPGPGTFNISSNGGTDIFLMKVKPTREFIWARNVGGTNNDLGFDIAVDPDGFIYDVGGFQLTADFDPTPSTFNMTAVDSADIYVLKWFNCFNPTYSTLSDTACGTYILNGQTYTVSGTYTQTIPNSAGCDSIITLNLVINRGIDTTVNVSICEGQSWYAGGANQTVSGIYKDTLVTSAGCDSIVTTMLTVKPGPKPNLGPDRKLCQGDVLQLYPGTFDSYLWQDNSTQPTLDVNSMGIYWVTVTDASTNCKATDTMQIIGFDTIPRNFLPADSTLCHGKSRTLVVPGYRNYWWSDGSIADRITIINPGIYHLTVTDSLGCRGTDSIRLWRLNCIPINIPNAFTPNRDGLNDVFRPVISQDILGYYMVVYNRYGQRIFETRDYKNGWDGTFLGKEQPIGAYTYRIWFTNVFGYTNDEKGTVMILR